MLIIFGKICKGTVFAYYSQLLVVEFSHITSQMLAGQPALKYGKACMIHSPISLLSSSTMSSRTDQISRKATLKLPLLYEKNHN